MSGSRLEGSQCAEFGDLFTVGELNERLADLATVLIPAR
jgi:hypothetical protein